MRPDTARDAGSGRPHGKPGSVLQRPKQRSGAQQRANKRIQAGGHPHAGQAGHRPDDKEWQWQEGRQQIRRQSRIHAHGTRPDLAADQIPPRHEPGRQRRHQHRRRHRLRAGLAPARSDPTTRATTHRPP